MKPVPAPALLGLSLLLATPALAQEPLLVSPPKADIPVAATRLPDFRAEALRSDAISIASSRIALERSRDPEVRDYARRVIANRQATTDALLPPGSSLGAGGTTDSDAEAVSTSLESPMGSVGLVDEGPTEPGRRVAVGPEGQAMIDRLRSIRSPQGFERDYVGQQVRSDARMLSLYEGYARNGDSVQGRRFANEALPYIAAEHDRSTLLDQRYGG